MTARAQGVGPSETPMESRNKPLLQQPNAVAASSSTHPLGINRGDISSFVRPVALIGRLPDGTGLSQHLLSLYRSVGLAVPMTTYEQDDDVAIATLAWDFTSYAALVVTESVVQHPATVTLLRDLQGKIPRILVLAWDSDQLDESEVDIIRQCFDVILPDSASLGRHWEEQVGWGLKWRPFPLNLDLRARAMGVRPRARRTGHPVIVGCVSAFHPRKQHKLLIDVLADLVSEGEDLELVLHSNLSHGDLYDRTREYAEQKLGSRAIVTNDNKTARDLVLLYQNLDVFVSLSQGETFNIPVREALAAGVPCVVSEIPGHEDLLGQAGVYGVPARIPVAAVYPERDHAVAGLQHQCTPEDAKTVLKALVRKVRVGLGPTPLETSRTGLLSDYRQRGHEMLTTLREAGAIEFVGMARPAAPRRRSSPTGPTDRLVLLAHDAGFFSVFNTYVSHVASWQAAGKGGFDEVLPDWSVKAVKQATGNETFESFCYAGQQEGNVFFRLFDSAHSQQGYGPDTDLASLEGAVLLTDSFNAKLDPYLTYHHASKLYRSLGFASWRQRMYEVVTQFAWPKEHLQAEVRGVRSAVPDGAPTLSMHVRHPSHAIEQADQSIALTQDFLHVADGWLSRQPDGYILLASDQETVVKAFKARFGERVVVREAAERTSEEADQRFASLTPEAQLVIGHQIQHLTAEQPEKWSSDFAADVIIDALFLSTGDTIVHSTSNVATAVAMLSPTIRMLQIRAGDDWDAIRVRALLEQRTQIL